MTRPLAIAALLAGAFFAGAPAHADPIVPQTCHYWTDYGFCTPAVNNPVKPRCFYWTDYPFCVPPA
ncbi:MAG: hypothetical protein QOE45_118 [Frankiaceae bacterium]|jgi:hypothetical protein|nr:hypothetical protein [Frankiaceae bacterium]